MKLNTAKIEIQIIILFIIFIFGCAHKEEITCPLSFAISNVGAPASVNPSCDINKNGVIDLYDVGEISRQSQ